MSNKRKSKFQYKSKFEAQVAGKLRNARVKFKYEPERIPYTLVLSKHYLPDFVLPNGIIVETKGRFVSDDRRKHLQVRKEHPHLDIRFVFMRDNTLSKKSKTKYSDWCNENGFKWAIGSVPTEWIKE